MPNMNNHHKYWLVNQVADCGDEDEDKDGDEVPSYAVLLTALVKRFGVSCMRDCQNVYHCVCLFVCLFVRLLTFEVPLKRLFAPTSRSWMSKIVSNFQCLGKVMKRSGLMFENFN